MKQWNSVVSALTTLFGVRLGMLCVLAIGLMGPGYAATVYTALSGGKTWTYTLDNSQNATIMGVDNSTGTLSLPAALDGHAVVAIGPRAFEGAAMTGVTIPDSVKSIGNYAFQDCTFMTNVTVGNGVTIIPYRCFDGCTKLNRVSLGTSVTDIGEYSFRGCQALKAIRFPTSVKKIWSYAFSGLANLESVQLNEGLEIIESAAFRECTALQSILLPATLKTMGSYVFNVCTQLRQIVIPNSVMSIGQCCFEDCSALTTVTWGSSLKTVPYRTFNGCKRLVSVFLPEGVVDIGEYSFEGCQALREIRFPSSVKKIWSYAFSGLTNLESVQLNEGLEIIESGAFRECTALQSILLPTTLKTMGGSVFNACTQLRQIVIPNSVTSIGQYCFEDCSALTTVTWSTSLATVPYKTFHGCKRLVQVSLPKGVTDIGEYSFYGCHALKVIELPSTVKKIYGFAFYGLERLETIVLNSGLEVIESNAFNGCELLDHVLIPNSVKTISGGAFANCISLSSIVVPDSVSSLGSQVFYGCSSLTNAVFGSGMDYVPYETFVRCSKLSQIEIRDGVLDIGEYAFDSCYALTSVTFPPSMRKVCASAFNGLSNLKKVYLNEGLEVIESRAFWGCSGLTELVLPSTLKTIKDSAFSNCSSLKTVVVPDSVTILGKDAFANCTSLYYAEIGDGVFELPYELFYGCGALCGVKLGRNVDTIWDYCFGYCGLLRYVQFESDSCDNVSDHAFYNVKPSMVIYVNPDATGLGETWQGFEVKDASKMPDNPYAPYDLAFCDHYRYPSKVFLMAYPDDGGTPVPSTRFVEGNPIFCWFGVRDLIGEQVIEDDICLGFYDGSGVKEYLNYDCSAIEEDRFYVNGMKTMTAKGLGANQLTVRIDAKDDFEETDKENNTATIAYTVVPGVKIDFVSEEAHYTSWNYESGTQYGWLPSVPTRLGYKFLGWFTEEEKGVQVAMSSVVPGTPTTLYAHWIVQPREIVAVGGTLKGGQTTWNSGNLYKVTSPLTVPAGAELVIEPGVTVKFASGTSLKVSDGSTLTSVGTRALPIVFTSMKDDAHGGDTDGIDATPTYNDWKYVSISGNATFGHTSFFYGGGAANSSESGMLIVNRHGTLVLGRCTLAHALYDGIFSYGKVKAVNTVVYDCDRGVNTCGGTGVFRNCVFDACRWSVMAEGGTGEYYNCIMTGFYGSRAWPTGWGAAYWNGSLMLDHCCVWSDRDGAVNYRGSVQTIECLNEDPLFMDPDNGDFRLNPLSPCVDAANGDFAPNEDFFGSPRMDVEMVRDKGTVGNHGAVPDIGIHEVPGTVDIPVADLRVTNVSVPGSLVIGQKVHVAWTVENVGEVDASGQWRDVVEIVAANGQVLELGESVVAFGVPAGASQTFTGDFNVPCGAEGPCRVRVTTNKYRDLFEAGRVENNVGSSGECRLSVSSLTLPTDGGETSVALETGAQTAFTLGNDTATSGVILIRSTGELSAWLGNGGTAARDNAVRSAIQVAEGLWLLEVPENSEARVSLSNDGTEPTSANLSLKTGAFFLLGVEKISAVNSGSVTIPLYGNGFAENMKCWLSRDGKRVTDASEVVVSDSLHGSAVVDVTELETGVYRLHLKKGEHEDSAELLTLTTSESVQAHWNCGLILAESVRANRVYVGKFGYENIGNAAKAAPYVTLKGSGGTLLRLSESDAWSESVDVLAISPTYPASSVKPGESNEIPFYYKTSGETANVTFECAGATRIVAEDGGFVTLGYLNRGGVRKDVTIPPGGQIIGSEVIEVTAHYKVIRYTVLVVVSKTEEPVDWDKLSDSMRPTHVPPKAWGVAFPKMKRAFGPTWKSYIAKLAADADYLMKLGQPTYRVDRLLRLEMNEALGVDLAVPKLASGTDLARSCRGPSLSFTRSYATSLAQRQTKGALGYGWSHGYETSVEKKDATTLVFHLPGGSSYTFTKVSGSWAPEDARDRSTLVETDAAYQLTSLDGTVLTFAKSTRRLGSIVDNQGRSVVFTYGGGRLLRAAHSDGQFLAFAYTGDLLSSITDDLGHVVTYAYNGNRLVAVTRPDGLVTRYAYRAETDGTLAYALVQTSAADGTTRDFTWDGDGRVATMSVNGTHRTTTIRRGPYGSYVLVAPNGAETAVTVGVNGETLKTVNALGETVSQSYTHDDLLESIVAPSGKRNKIAYDKYGSPISSMSASGATTSFTYTEDFASLDSVTDAKGHAFRYGYDDLGRSTSVGYVDGSSSSLEYNDKGDVVKSTNRRGESIAYAYNGKGKLVRKTWGNGRSFTLAYDAKGNVTNAADSVTGPVTMEYDAHERLTKIVYPKNRGFTFKYDVAGRQIERAALDGTKECYEYDAFGRLARVTDGTRPYLTNVYDPVTGWIVTQTYGNGTVVSNAYDKLGRTIGIYHLKDNTSLAFFEYAYDKDGKCVSQTTAEGVESYTYDADGQLTGVIYPDGTAETFAYDAVGNRTTANGATYTVNDMNQYTTISGGAAPVSNLTYDLDGNLTSKTDADGTTTYAYDTLNRLVAVTNVAKNIRWSCEYDVFGNRVSVTDNGKTTEKLFVQGSLASVVAEYVGGVRVKRHVVVGAVRLADRTANAAEARYYHADLLGSTRLLTDGRGTTKGTRSYRAFGETRLVSGETPDAGYVGTLGIETDPTGFLFMRNRYYSASLGRFVQMDPIGINGGQENLYVYCQNDVILRNDPSGLFSKVGTAYALKYIATQADKFGGWLGNKSMVGKVGAFFISVGTTFVNYGCDLMLEEEGVIGKGESNANFWKNIGWNLFSHGVKNGMDKLMEDYLLPGQSNDSLINKAIDVVDNVFWLKDTMMSIYGVFKQRPPEDEYETITSTVKISHDPNEMAGPAGTGEKRFVQQGEWMNYTIYFENKTNATAAAQEVFVDLPMDENLDWSTLELGEIAFGEHIDMGLVGKSHGTTRYANPGTNTFVKTTVKQKNGVLSWYIRDWDPTTADNFPTSVEGGFLPPNNPATHCGEGHLSYRVRVKDTAPNGAIIRASAQIVFDSNPMIETDPAWWNTVGSEATGVQFTESEVLVSEGEALSLSVTGGASDTASSVKVFLSYQTAAAADLDLAKGMIDGVVPKGGLKFPLTLNWAAGEVTNRVITIPVKADRAVEDDEVLTFQLAAAQGQDIGEASVCTVTLVDANTAVTLQDGAMSATVKLTSKASKSGGAWNVAPGNMLDPDGSRGLYHAESPVLAPGGRSMLSAGPLSSGYLYFRIRFTGPVEEEKPSTVTVYRGNSFIGVIGHGTTLRDGWKVCASNDWNGVKVTFSGRGPINLVFTQGSDPTVHAEISCLRYDATDKDLPVYKILALPSDPSGGHVTGAGLYTKGAVVPLSAKPKPGWEFTGWYTYGTNETRRLWDNKANVSGKVVGDFEVFAEFVRMPYIRALADPADGGKVSGSGYCAAGKKVALKATASRNFTFAGWYAAGAPDAPVATTPTLVLDRSAKHAKGDARQTVLTDVDGDATYFARFVGDPEVSVAVSATDGRGAEPAGKGAGRYVAGTVTGAGRYAPGKKAVLKATANRGYVFAGWREAGADGTLSRSAAYTIGAMPPDDVALVAAFVTADEDRESVAASLGGLPLAPWVSKTETHALATNVRAGVYLEWPLAASALSETTVKVAGLPAGLRFAAKPVTSRSGTGRSAVFVTNVPANTVYGAPTAASRTVTDRRTGAVTVTPSAVKVTVTTAGRSSRTYQIDATVDPLPAWAQGTFAGVSYADADGAETNGLAAVSVTAAGKVSAKQTAAGRAASFTAPWYDRHDAAEDAYHATLTAKVGAAVVTNRVTVRAAAHAATDAVPAETALGVMRGDLLDAWQTDWRREPWKGFAAALARARPPLACAYEVGGGQPGTVSLKFGANGAVTAAGTFATGVDARGRETTAKASCSATLLPQGGDRYLVFVYFPPKGTFRGHARCLALAWDGAGFVEDVAW